MAQPFCPKRGDVVWFAFNPQAGHKQAGRRLALTLSPEAYNRKVEILIVAVANLHRRSDNLTGAPVSRLW